MTLDQSFCCFKGISADAEAVLWRSGCLTWRHFEVLGRSLVSERKFLSVGSQIKRLETALSAGADDCIIQAFPSGHKVRALPQDLTDVAFLDIETTGLSLDSHITLIGVAMNGEHRAFVRDRDLDDFLLIWPKIKILVTFNGKRFDVPMLAREFGLSRIPAHIDLLYETKAWGYSGGLKNIERLMGIARETNPIASGADAAAAWDGYVRTHNPKLLQDLITYNRQDTENLADVVETLLRLSWRDYPLKRQFAL